MSFVNTLKNVALLKPKEKSIKGVVLIHIHNSFCLKSTYVSCTKKGKNVFLYHFSLELSRKLLYL